MAYGPLEFPAFPVVKRPRKIWRWQEDRWVVEICMAENISGPHILYLKPSRGERDYRNCQFPAVSVVSRDILLAVAIGARATVNHVKDLLVMKIDYHVVDTTGRQNS